MNCICGEVMQRQEDPTKSGNRRTVHSCPHCYRFELELRTRGGLLVIWRHGVLSNAAQVSGTTATA